MTCCAALRLETCREQKKTEIMTLVHVPTVYYPASIQKGPLLAGGGNSAVGGRNCARVQAWCARASAHGEAEVRLQLLATVLLCFCSMCERSLQLLRRHHLEAEHPGEQLGAGGANKRVRQEAWQASTLF